MNNDAREIFVSNLKKIMKISKKTQKQISDDLKIPLSTVSSWVNGQSYPRVDKMQMLADYLNVSMRELTDSTHEDSPFGSDEDIMKYLCSKGREDLWQTFKSVSNNDSLQILMDSAADLTPEDLEPVLILVQGIRKSKGLE